jgi:hypothetical protein
MIHGGNLKLIPNGVFHCNYLTHCLVFSFVDLLPILTLFGFSAHYLILRHLKYASPR